jgi:heptosyltransferase-3
MSKPVFSTAGLRRALVIKLRHHGDVLLAAPVISALKHHAPGCEVDALVYADTAPMLEGHPALSQLHLIDRNWKRQGLKRQTGAEWRLIRALRARRYDLVVHLSVHTRGAWLVRLLRPRWSVAPKFRPGFWEKSFTHLYPAQSHPDRHTVDTNLDSLRALGIQPMPQDMRVSLVPGARRKRASNICWPRTDWSRAATSMSIRPRAGASSAGRRNALRPCVTNWQRVAGLWF